MAEGKAGGGALGGIVISADRIQWPEGGPRACRLGQGSYGIVCKIRLAPAAGAVVQLYPRRRRTSISTLPWKKSKNALPVRWSPASSVTVCPSRSRSKHTARRMTPPMRLPEGSKNGSICEWVSLVQRSWTSTKRRKRRNRSAAMETRAAADHTCELGAAMSIVRRTSNSYLSLPASQHPRTASGSDKSVR